MTWSVGEVEAKKAIDRAVKWEEDPANAEPQEEEEFIFMIAAEEEEICLMLTADEAPQTTAATPDDGRPDSGTVSTYHCYMCRRNYWDNIQTDLRLSPCTSCRKITCNQCCGPISNPEEPQCGTCQEN